MRAILEYAKKLRKAADVLEELFREAPSAMPAHERAVAEKIGQRAAKHLSKKHGRRRRPSLKRGDDGLTDRERQLVDYTRRYGPAAPMDVAKELRVSGSGIGKIYRRLAEMKVVRKTSHGLYQLVER